jgi:enoyl-CoA hydratase
MPYPTLILDVDNDGVALLTVNRPDKLNALNASVLSDLDACFDAMESNEAVRGIIVTGSGEKAFVAGADIAEFKGLGSSEARALSERGQQVFQRIEGSRKPVIAAVNGFALGGGCELALACHIRIASEGARFGQPEVNLGLIPGYGGTQRLPRLIGSGLAAELLLTGDMISAARAYEIGLVNRVVSGEELIESARKMMNKILSKAPLAVSMVLEAIRDGHLSLKEGLHREATLFGRAFETKDFEEGVSAFLEKRAPKFKGE